MASEGLKYLLGSSISLTQEVGATTRRLEVAAAHVILGSTNLLDTGFSSERILQEFNSSHPPTPILRGCVKGTIYVGVAVALAYGARVGFRRWRRKQLISPYLDTHRSLTADLAHELSAPEIDPDDEMDHNSMATEVTNEFVTPEVHEEVPRVPGAPDILYIGDIAIGLEDYSIVPPPSPTVLVAGHGTVPPPNTPNTTVTASSLRTPTRRKRFPFVTKVVMTGKARFYGLPTSTQSNHLAVSKFVEEMCKERKCTPTQTRVILALAVPAIFSPDQWDVAAAQSYNLEERCQNRAALKAATSLDSWIRNLICHPLSGRAWRRAFDVLAGLPDWQAYQIIK